MDLKSQAEECGGINFIDLGCIGGLDSKWDAIKNLANLVGFDPDQAECARLTAQENPYRSQMYLPYAISGKKETRPFYHCRYPYNNSLLPPNSPWLSRLAVGPDFEVVGTQDAETVSLGDVEEIAQMDVDVLKIDTQGMEYPILSSAPRILEKAFVIETETGFLENYRGETTYAQIDPFMRAHGFRLFGLTTHRVSRNNPLKMFPCEHSQLFYCEALWMKDYVALQAESSTLLRSLDRSKALKAILLCRALDAPDFGYELASLFAESGFISKQELRDIRTLEFWRSGSNGRAFFSELAASALSVLPWRFRKKFADTCNVALSKPNPIKAALKNMQRRAS